MSIRRRRRFDPDAVGWRILDSRLRQLVQKATTVDEIDVAFWRYFLHLRKLRVDHGPRPRYRTHWSLQ